MTGIIPGNAAARSQARAERKERKKKMKMKQSYFAVYNYDVETKDVHGKPIIHSFGRDIQTASRYRLFSHGRLIKKFMGYELRTWEDDEE